MLLVRRHKWSSWATAYIRCVTVYNSAVTVDVVRWTPLECHEPEVSTVVQPLATHARACALLCTPYMEHRQAPQYRDQFATAPIFPFGDQVVDALELGSATLGKIKANLGWALAYNAVGIPLAAGRPAHTACQLWLSPSAAGCRCSPLTDAVWYAVRLTFRNDLPCCRAQRKPGYFPIPAGALLPTFGIALNPSIAAAMMAFSSVAVVSNSLLLRATKFSTDGATTATPATATATPAAGAGHV